MSFSSSIHGCLTWSLCREQFVLHSIALMLRLEFYGGDLDTNLQLAMRHDIRSFNPCALHDLLLLQPSSASCVRSAHPLSAPSTAKFPFLLNSLLHSSLVSYSIFLHINQSF